MAWGESSAWLDGEQNDALYQKMLDDAVADMQAVARVLCGDA